MIELKHEQRLAEKSFSSAADFKIAAFYIDFPQKPEGRTILDVGSGASTAILELQKRGAFAVGIDYRYQNIRWVKSSAERSFQGTNPITRHNNQVRESPSRKSCRCAIWC